MHGHISMKPIHPWIDLSMIAHAHDKSAQRVLFFYDIIKFCFYGEEARLVRVTVTLKLTKNLREVSFKTQYSFPGTNVDLTLISTHERRSRLHTRFQA